MQSLWIEVDNQHGGDYNGVVEAGATIFGAIAAAFVSFLNINWSVWGELTIGGLSLLDSILLTLSSTYASTLWEVYLIHVFYKANYSFLITIARSVRHLCLCARFKSSLFAHTDSQYPAGTTCGQQQLCLNPWIEHVFCTGAANYPDIYSG